MKSKLALVATLIALGAPATAQTMLDKIKDGASNVADGTSKLVTGAVESVDESIKSTQELLSNEETPELTRQRLDTHTEETLVRLFDEVPEARALYEQSTGFAAFDARRVSLVGVSGGFGRGVAVSRETGARTYMQMGTGGVSLNFGIGGFDRQIVILFEDPALFAEFTTGGYDATAETGVMFNEDKAEESVRFVDGRTIFVLTKKGWKVSASATGTRYWVDDKLN